jgi:hypothetical protein
MRDTVTNRLRLSAVKVPKKPVPDDQCAATVAVDIFGIRPVMNPMV